MLTQEPLFSYEDALGATMAEIDPLPAETIPLSELAGRMTVNANTLML